MAVHRKFEEIEQEREELRAENEELIRENEELIEVKAVADERNNAGSRVLRVEGSGFSSAKNINISRNVGFDTVFDAGSIQHLEDITLNDNARRTEDNEWWQKQIEEAERRRRERSDRQKETRPDSYS